MKKKILMLVISLVFLVLLNLSAKKEDKYEMWIDEEVNLIITDAEKAEYEKLKKDKDKEFFIKLFWAKRDPTPQTEKNEFREEYYSRLSYVKKGFRYGYKTGTKTDMGKVYLYFGKPGRVFRQDPRYEIWVYPTQPWMDIPKETFTFVFTAVEVDWTHDEARRNKEPSASLDSAGYVFDLSKTEAVVMRTFYAYPKTVLLYPDLKELPEYKEVITFSPDSFEGKLIQQMESTQENITRIPFEEKALFTKAENLSSYLTFLLKIDPGESEELVQKKINFFGRIESEAYSCDFRQEKALAKEDDYFISQMGFPVLPGEYKLFLGFYTQDKKTYSIKMDQIDVPNFWSQELALSSILASSQVQEKKAPDKAGDFNVFSLGRYSLSPSFNQEYTKEEFLNVFYYIYNVAVDSSQNCSLLIEFELQIGEKKYKLNSQIRKQKIGEEATLLEGTQIPLSALPESGEYELTIRVTDELAKKAVSRKLKFLIQ